MRNISLTLLTLALTIPFTDITLAKPTTTETKKTNNSKSRGTPVGEGVKFFFNGCTQITAQEKVVCVGTFRSISGERKVTMYREDYRGWVTTITDTKGKSYIPNEIRVGGDYTCIKGNCSYLDMTLVEGVDYKTIFIFTDISLPTAKIPLLSINTNGGQNYLKYRNIPVSTSGENSSSSSGGDYQSISDADIPADILNPKSKATALDREKTSSQGNDLLESLRQSGVLFESFPRK
jgi:hypothetical protein